VTPLYVVLMFGARDWDEFLVVEREIIKLKETHGTKDLLIVSGKAPGADTCAAVAANKNDIHCAEIAALWGTRHQSAGPQRNDIMARLNPNEAIGFHKHIAKSRGTADMRRKLLKLHIPTRIVTK
jgi:hypothetical protein